MQIINFTLIFIFLISIFIFTIVLSYFIQLIFEILSIHPPFIQLYCLSSLFFIVRELQELLNLFFRNLWAVGACSPRLIHRNQNQYMMNTGESSLCQISTVQTEFIQKNSWPSQADLEFQLEMQVLKILLFLLFIISTTKIC